MNHFYFYHLVPKGTNLSKGLLAPYAAVKFDKHLALRMVDKYRNRLVNGWAIYPGRDPKSLTLNEVLDGIDQFRGEGGTKCIYFFKFPPHKELGPNMADILRHKDIIRIDLKDPELKKCIEDIDWGYEGSFTGSPQIPRSYYETVDMKSYFRNYNDNPKAGTPPFAPINHIGIQFKNGICPAKFLTKINSAGENMKSTHDEMSALMEMMYDDTDKHHLKKYVQENGCLPNTSLLGIEPTMEKTVTYGEELAPKNMNRFKIREDRKDMTRGYMDPEVIYNPPKNFKNLDQISGLELQTFKGFRKLDDNIKMIFHSGSDYNCIGYIRCPETGIQLTKRWMPEASGRIERYDYYIKDSKGHGGKFELWFNPDRHYASEAALVLEASAHGEEISMQDVKRKIKFVEGDKGTMNSVYVMNGKQYRVRVETLVVRNLHGEPHIFFQKKDAPSSYGQMYKLPGGSVEPNKDWATQASAECNEEILTKVKNIRYTGVSYIKEYPPGKTPSWQRASVLYQKGVDYTGAITFVFVAEYDGPYKKYVHAIDRDSLAKEGKWYPVKDFNHLCNDEHKGIVYGVKLVSDEPSADAMTEGFQPIEEVSVVKKIVGKIFGKDKQVTKERQMSAERLKRRKDVVNHTFDFVGKFLAKTLKNPEFARCFTKDESMLRKWEQGGGKYTTVLYWDKKRFKGSDEEWNKCYKAFRREVSMHRTDVKGFSIGCARGSNSSNGLIQLTDHSKLWRPLNEVFVTQEDYSLMGSLPKKKVHRKVVSRHAMNGKNKVKIVSQEQQYPDWL